MTERETAIAIARGKAPSPTRFQNSWLYAMRITGTGVSYRVGLKEFVWRNPESFLTDEFVQRCNGLPVILVHPDSSLLDGNEYANRSIGTILYPYRALNGREDDTGDEVWGIARLFDDELVSRLREGNISTSPGVQFLKGDALARAKINGENLLIEGEPSLIDHIAIVSEGVWDKGGPPSGIRNDSVSDEKSEGEREYGEVKFADPENDKYPIDTEEHIRAAWNYIHQGRDADKYDHEKLASIKSKIVSAWKQKISKDGPPEAHEDTKMADGEGKIIECVDALSKRFDDLMTAFDAMGKRLDSVEKKKKDGETEPETKRELETEREDGKKKREDANSESEIEPEEEPEEEKREDAREDARVKDARRKDAKPKEKVEHEPEEKREPQEKGKRKDAPVHIQSKEPDLGLETKIAEMQRRLDALSAEPDFDDATKLVDAQRRADKALQSLGERIEQPLFGESSLGFRRRILAKLQKYSPKLKGISLHGLAGPAFEAIEDAIYADAQVASRSDPGRTIGRLIPIVTRDGAGREITRYEGDSRAWRRQFSAPSVGFAIDRRQNIR